MAATGCGDNVPNVADELPGFELTVHGRTEGTLRVSGDYGWWRNTIPESEYRSWATQYEDENWTLHLARAAIRIYQHHELFLEGSLELDEDHSLDFVNISAGFGWRAIYPEVGDVRPFDLTVLGMAPEEKSFDRTDFSDCEVEDSRLLIALSKYPGTPEELLAEAVASAAEQGLDEPESWYDVVRDPVMYEQLFGYHGTHLLVDATFAFLSAQIDPQCGNLRLSFRSEQHLVGPVTRVN